MLYSQTTKTMILPVWYLKDTTPTNIKVKSVEQVQKSAWYILWVCLALLQGQINNKSSPQFLQYFP